MPSPQRAAPHALVISTDPLTAALLGLLLQLEQVPVVYHEGDGEPLDVVFERVRPTVVLVDVDHPDGFSEAFTVRARSAGARVVAFSPTLETAEVEGRAAERGVSCLGLPTVRADFAAAIAAAS
jgi:DNA-binding response OmpR family regulator